jgi:hypothetical protein
VATVHSARRALGRLRPALQVLGRLHHARPAHVRVRRDRPERLRTVLTGVGVVMKAGARIGPDPRDATATGLRRAGTAVMGEPPAAPPGLVLVGPTRGVRAALVAAPPTVPDGPGPGPRAMPFPRVVLVPARLAVAPAAIVRRAEPRVEIVRHPSGTPRAARAPAEAVRLHGPVALPEPGVARLGVPRVAVPMNVPLVGSRRRPSVGRWRSRPLVVHARRQR